MYKEYVAVIQAGGKGTRMKELTGDRIPKPMLPLNGKPMLQWQVKNISEYGIKEFVFIIGHLGEKIKGYFGDGSRLGIHIRYIEERKPLGSAGALFYLKDLIQAKDILLIYGDVMFCLDWGRMIDFHECNGGRATLLVHPNAHPFDSDLLMVDEKNRVTGISYKSEKRNYWYENCVNSGIFIIQNQVIQEINALKKMDLEKDILKPLMVQGVVYGYRTPEYVKDAGTPDRFRKVEAELLAGIWDKKCLNKKQKCVFLDRDGTINQYRGLTCQEEQFELEEHAADAIRLLNSEGYLAIVITNQPVAARGMCNIDNIIQTHRKMQVLLGMQGAYLDDIVFCLHQPDKGCHEENSGYEIPCGCRKPSGGVIGQMVSKYNIDLTNSYMIGDTTVDIQMGINAGTKTILVLTGQAGLDKKYDVKPDFISENLLDAVNRIIGGYGGLHG